MAVSIGNLLQREDLGLEPLSGLTTESAMNAPVTWASHSNLVTPMPYLSSGELLLTTTSQFNGAENPAEALSVYATQLKRWGIAGLIVGPEEFGAALSEQFLAHVEVLRACCAALELPLALARRRPFIHIVRAVVESITEERLAWERRALEIQRRLSDASLREDALSAILEEVDWSLGCWSMCFDSGGRLLGSSAMANSISKETTQLVKGESLALLAKGLRAKARVQTDHGVATVQTLGDPEDLLGVFVYGPPEAGLDEERSATASAATLLSLSILRRRDTLSARGEILSAAMRLVLLGHPIEAAEICGPGVHFPEEPFRLVAISAPATADSAAQVPEHLHRRLLTGSSFAAYHHGVLLWLAGSLDEVEDQLEHESVLAGISGETTFSTIETARRQAKQALDISRLHGGPLTVFGQDPEGGLLQTVPLAPGFSQQAEALIKPLLDHDRAQNTDLAASLYQWLAHQGAWEAAAGACGIHRHTLRTHVARAAEILDVDLAFADVRVELWLALHLRHSTPLP